MVNPRPRQPGDDGAIGVDDIERRDLRRISIDCNALLRLAEYLTFRARLCNISTDAVQVICEPRYALLIHPAGVGVAPDEDRLIDISVALPEYGDVGEFKARCRVKYCVEYDESRLALGLQFVAMDFQSVQHLDRFMESRAQEPVGFRHSS